MDFLDVGLLIMLVVILPTRAIWRSIRQSASDATTVSRVPNYQRSISVALFLTVCLAAIWIARDRSIDALGLAPPTSLGAMIGMCIAVVVAVSMIVIKPRQNPERDRQALAQSDHMMPQDDREQAWFIALALVAGFSWEVLYRGYLIWLLAPLLGLIASVLTSAIIYGLAHGIKSLKQVASSIAAALVFTSAYAVSGNLWWLILLHAMMPLIGMIAVKRLRDQVAQAG